MDFPRYLAQTLTFRGGRTFTKLSVLLAVVSIGLGVAVMEVSLSIVQGFDEALTAKIVGFVSDVEISAYQASDETMKTPIPNTSELPERLKAEVPGVQAVDPVVTLEGLLQSSEGHEGVQLKGVPPGWQNEFFACALVAGRLPEYPPAGAEPGREVLISATLARLLNLKVGDNARLVFYQDNKARFRKVKIAGLYETGLVEFDQHMVLTDIRLLQQVLGWHAGQVEAYEVRFAPGRDLPREELAARIDMLTPHSLKAQPVEVRYPELFDWIGLQHQNVLFIQLLMAIVAVVNMATAILILITERTQSIGLLKALGATAGLVRRSFLWQAFYLILVGVLLGNLLAFTLMFVQQQTGLFSLDPESYFVKTVPVAWPWLKLLLVNAAVVLLCTFAMLLPTAVINRISPVRALRFS